MTDSAGNRAELLRGKFLGQTALIPWRELQTHYARGRVVVVQPALDLVEVAVQLGMDNAGLFRSWIERGEVAAVSDDQARAWVEDERELWAVVAPPWVLVQVPG